MIKKLLLGIIGAAMAAAMMTSPAQADPPLDLPTPPTPPAGPTLPAPAGPSSADQVVVQEYLPDGKTLVATHVYGPETMGQLMGGNGASTEFPRGMKSGRGPLNTGSGSGGTSTFKGCDTVTVTHKESTLGTWVYTFKTWTSWCWDRTTQVIYNVSHDWKIQDVDALWYWKGIVKKDFQFYDRGVQDGQPYSAYKNYMMGEFDNCIIGKGCIASSYPWNDLRTYADGTWMWWTGT